MKAPSNKEGSDSRSFLLSCGFVVWMTANIANKQLPTQQRADKATISVWKTVPSEARVTRDEVSGDKNAKTAVWKTVPNYAL